MVRFAVSQPDVEQALDECAPALTRGFRADRLSIRTYATDDAPPIRSSSLPASEEVRDLVEELSRRVLDRATGRGRPRRRRQRLARRATSTRCSPRARRARASAPRCWCRSAPAAGASGTSCSIATTATSPGARPSSRAASTSPATSASAVLNARTLAREQRLVDELRQLSSYKTELLSTVSHELKNPLGALTGHLELVTSADQCPREVRFSLAAVDARRGASSV